MKPDAFLDYAVFQLSPKRSRCELFVSSDGNTEKLASGLVKPFVAHLKVAEDQVALAVQSIILEAGNQKNSETWFTKGTLERFVRFVSTPDVLEMVNTLNTEMSQLEAARRIYSQGVGDNDDAIGGDGAGNMAAADATKKELLRAIDVRLVAVRQDLTVAYSRAYAAGFNPDTVSEIQLFADHFGAYRLNEACTKFLSMCERRPDLINQWKPNVDDKFLRSSIGSDMSIDEPINDLTGSRANSGQINHTLGLETEKAQAQLRHHLDQSKMSVSQQLTSVTAFLTQGIVNAKDKGASAEDEKKQESLTETPSIQASQPGRRLSVQDRINLFENKQKETSGGKPSVGKSVELRRLSSDVSSASAVVPEKAVLRRWSGASDMSIDVSGEKDSTGSPLDTPTPTFSSVSRTKSDAFPVVSQDNNQKGLTDTASSVKIEAESGSDSGLKNQGHLQSPADIGKEEQVRSKEQDKLKKQAALPTHLNGQQIGVSEHGFSQRIKASVGSEDHMSSGMLSRGSSNWGEIVGEKDEVVFRNQIGASTRENDASDRDSANRVDNVRQRDQPETQSRIRSTQTHSRSLSGQLEGGFGLKLKEGKSKATGQLASQPQWKSFNAEMEEVGTKKMGASDKLSTPGDYKIQRIKFQKPGSVGHEQIKKLQIGREEDGSPYTSGKRILDVQDTCGTVSASVAEEVQRVRQSKGNQELNDELKMKANELEKLFAEHKLRVPGDQSNSVRRVKPTDVKMEHAVSFQHKPAAASAEISPTNFPDRGTRIPRTGSSSNIATPISSSLVMTKDYQDTLRHNYSELDLSYDSRGKFYESYMQKRDAKLREEWDSRRPEKEAKMKAMQDSLEHSKSVMKTKLAGADNQDSVSSARRRAEKLRSFNFHSSLKREHSIDSVQDEEDGDLSEVTELKFYEQDRLSGETFVGEGAFRSTQSKKIPPTRNNLSSFVPRTVATQVPRYSGKASNSGPGKRRAQSENPLAQSVPNFTDFRKENTKSSPGVSKMTTRSQVRNYARSKSNSEEVGLAKEDKRRSQSLRKSSTGPVECTDSSPLNSEDVLAPLRLDMEETDKDIFNKFTKNVDTKTFLRKGNDTGSSSGANVTELKTSAASESLKDEEESDELASEEEDSVTRVKEEDEELQTMEIEDYAILNNGKPKLDQKVETMNKFGSENDDSMSLSHVDPVFVAELPTAIPSTFHTVRSLQDSPGESPVSWNSRLHNPFCYPHETSDIDASVDSPMGSPASWNSHSMTQTEVDAARMRKKWGSSQKPILVATSSHTQSRKDMTKGFKRLLKFGRKNRGSESLADWISATTSEGDDDMEDVRDPASQSSEDLRKSRMGLSQGFPSEENFNESELFNQQVRELRTSIPAPPMNFKLREDHISGSSLKAPRSFFSLSSFRSKGSDSKPR